MKSIFTVLIFLWLPCGLYAQTAPNLAWAKRLGNNSLIGVYPSAITTDNFGNSFIAGVFTTNGANIGGAVLSSPNNAPSDGYIIKYNAQGQLVWSMTTHNILIGHVGNTQGPNPIDLDCNRMATDNEGNLYVTGKCKKLIGYRSRIFNYYFPLDSALVYPYSNHDFPFVAKISANGTVVWVKTFTDDNVYVAAVLSNTGGLILNYQNEIFIDTYSNLNLTGVFYNRIGFDSTHVLYTDTSYNPADIDTIRTVDNVYDSVIIRMRQQAGMYKATFNPQGNVISAVKLSSAEDEYLANQRTTFYHVPPPSVPNVSPILLAQYQRETKRENARADAGNNLYRLRHRNISNNLDTKPVLYSYTPSGVLLAIDTLPISASTAFQINDFKVTPTGDIVLTGIWKGILTINGVTHAPYSTASYDGFVCVLNNDSHTTQSLYTRKTATDDYLVRAEVDELGNIYVCGHFTASFVGYIAKINSAGTLLWEQQINKINSASLAGFRWAKFLSQNQNGNVWVSGAYYHSVYFNNTYQFTTPINTNQTSFNGFLAQYGQCNTAKPVWDSAPYTQVCAGDSLLLTANFSDTATYNYQWSTGDTTQSIYVTQPGKYFYIAQHKEDTQGCYGKSNEVWVSERPLPDIHISASDSVVCAGTAITLSASGAETYTWSNGISNDVAFVPNNTNTYTVTALDSNGCSNTALQSIIVNSLPEIQITASDTIVCAGTTITLSASGADTYTWSNGISNEVAFVPENTDTYTVTGEDANGCSKTIEQTIVVNQLPDIQISASDSVVCAGTAITLSASGAETYTWSNGISNDVAFIPNNTNTYTVTALDSNGCSNTALQSIIVNALPEIQISASDSIVCAGTTITLSANGADTYTWSNDINNDVAFVPDSTSTYTVTGTDTAGCSNTATQSIIVNALPTTPVITVLDSVLTSSATGGNQWYFEGLPIVGVTEQTHTATQNGNYYVVVTDTNNCTSQSTTVLISITSVATHFTNSGIIVYPNPTNGIVYFSKTVSIQLTNSAGQIIANKKNIKLLDLSKQPAGMYFVLFFDHNGKLIQHDKIVKE
jgi:hypothetical protein